jgi:hypothetical protein
VKDAAEIAAAYQIVDALLEERRGEAAAKASSPEVARIEARQKLNDQAYFILAWGQLETEIDEKCRAAIRKARQSPGWRDRRVWDLFNPDDRRLSGLSFEERAAVVLDKNGGSGSPWAKVQNYYALRNQIAHGTLRPERIDVAEVVNDFWVIQAALQV